MIETTVTIEGLDKIQKALQKAPQETVSELGKAVKKSILTLQNAAMREAPVNKQTGGGNLRQNIRTKMMTSLRGMIESMAPYSIFVHEGTRPHVIRPVIKKGLANRRTGEYFGKVVNHPGTRANPYFTRAIDRDKDKIDGFFNDAIQNVLKMF